MKVRYSHWIKEAARAGVVQRATVEQESKLVDPILYVMEEANKVELVGARPTIFKPIINEKTLQLLHVVLVKFSSFINESFSFFISVSHFLLF